MVVKFFFSDATIQLTERNRLKAFIKQLFTIEGVLLSSLNYIFCSDEYLIGINKEFLDHDNYTDIITFCLSEAREPIDGEIYISVDRVKENAITLGISVKTELHRVIFHGALHLCGYKDKKPIDKIRMTSAENRYLALYYS